jgi:hypothetical protein
VVVWEAVWVGTLVVCAQWVENGLIVERVGGFGR